TDPLTGLANRRAFVEALEAHVGQKRSGCLAIIDIDHFKQVNDRHGHAAGDRVLQAFGEVARSTLRSSDMVARIGGEEFAVILPETG
ncbi:GGDEF domain-containing protein, partial [Enterococcus faecalis]|uniref:GGDEF domain-containing protein n=1 Tax=Enterococcus faecalis TaxID=1351 RepID=UPI00403F6014